MGDAVGGGSGELSEALDVGRGASPEWGGGPAELVEGALTRQRGCVDTLGPTTANGGPAGAERPLRVPPQGEDFTPVPTRQRDDGWSPARQRAFLEALASCGSVSAAARSIGMSRESDRKSVV